MKRAFSHDIGKFTEALWLALLIVFHFPSVVRADRVYHLVDRPGLQEGYSLSGTITTTDDAPLDSILENDEILHWEWRISGSNDFSFSASRDDFITDVTRASGVIISPLSISLPLDAEAIAMLRLHRTDALGDFPSNTSAHTLSWFKDFPAQTTTGTRYHASRVQEGQGPVFWNSLGPPADAGVWEIATAIPEPSSLVLAALCAVTVGLRRARPRQFNRS